MKFLPFERTYQLESTSCTRCAGSGVYAAPAPAQPRDCWNCRGLGRKISREGRQLFDEICALLGATLPERESRIQPGHLDTIPADRIRTGMIVREMRSDGRRTPRGVTSIQSLPLEQLRLTFTDGSIVNAAPYDSFVRQLAPDELLRVEALMAQRVGAGATLRGASSDAEKAEASD